MFQQKFINRSDELKFLNNKYREKNNLIIIYGRRRVGKTELIRQFIKDKKHIYFLADTRSGLDNLKQFQKIAGTHIQDNLFIKAHIEDWEELFFELSKKTREKLIIVIDEFPYLIEADKSIPSVFQKIWDLNLADKNIFLILSGSSISMMENHLLNYRAPLYGRRTGQLLLKTLKFRHLKDFLPTYSKEDLVHVFGVCDGIPLYIQQFSDKYSFYDNLFYTVFNSGQFLYQELEFILKQEFKEPARYFSILHSIANNKMKFGDIVIFTQMDKSVVSKYLDTLIMLHFVKKEYPVIQKKETRNANYIITDNYTKFWFRFIYPNKSAIEEKKQDFLSKQIKKDFNAYLGYVFEDISKQLLWEKMPFDFVKIGRQWGKVPKSKETYEIDLVALNDDKKEIGFFECKWQDLTKNNALNILEKLKQKSKFVDWNLDNRKEHFGLIGKKIQDKEELKKQGFFAWDLDDFKFHG
ncbi:MAG: ATP-binding protein [Candidatus Aenigmarchaeota archaeon]|nr:ATP-binding protein [Candidatus Aenigmarchaeota archaeon]